MVREKKDENENKTRIYPGSFCLVRSCRMYLPFVSSYPVCPEIFPADW
jgi:hypothetical protein